MINCNPETVSTDFDTSEKLYFEPLNLESVINVIEKEKKKGNLIGVIVQYGGQTPLKLADDLDARDVKILGTTIQIHRNIRRSKTFQRSHREVKTKTTRKYNGK